MAASEDFRRRTSPNFRRTFGELSENFPEHGRNVSRIVRMLFHTGTVCFPVLTVWVRAVRVQSLAQFCHSRATSRLGQKDERKKDSYHGTVVSYGGIIDCFIGYTSVTSTS